MYQALYRKYRPQNFEDVVGQKVIVKTLCNAIKNDKITHAYLFTGPRGTGKTSIAKIFAKTINCEHLENLIPCNNCNSCIQFNNKQTVDIIEIDAASNNSVEEIRELKNNVNLVPTNGKYKVYIIDEVHMLTTAAFNAMLKTLEEPPKNVIFILATTEPHKIPLTILSRCQRFDFEKIGSNQIAERLKYITLQENINVEDGVLDLIADISNGGMRDSIGFLDQLIAFCDDQITMNDVHEINGSINTEQIYDLTLEMIKNNSLKIFELIDYYDSNGKNLSKILEKVIEYLKNVLIYLNCSNYFENKKQIEQYEQILNLTTEEEICIYIDNFLDTLKALKYENNKKLLIELSIIKSRNIINTKKNYNIQKNHIQEEQFAEKETTSEKNDLQLNQKINNGIKELKKIRINNTLANFNKKQLMDLKNNINNINDLINVSKYSATVSLILDGDLKARGKENLIFVYNSESLEQCFNSQIILIEEIFQEVFHTSYKVIAVNEREWNQIKKDFNDNMKQNKNIYQYREENINVEDLFKSSIDTNKIIKNDIDNMFSEIVEYK